MLHRRPFSFLNDLQLSVRLARKFDYLHQTAKKRKAISWAASPLKKLSPEKDHLFDFHGVRLTESFVERPRTTIIWSS